ncbi:MAG: histidine kinase [Bacteroides sp.]|nr:histidine kinase [Bacteroides sp.]
MRKKNEWINSYFIALLFSMCFFVVVDIAYDDPIWEFQSFALWARLQNIVLIMVVFFVAGYYYQRIAHHFFDKSNGKNKANRKEYVFVFLINLIAFNIVYMFIIYFITEEGFRWKEFLLNNSTVPILMLLYYMMVRNKVLFNSYVEQSLQLEKVKVNQLETELKFLKSQYHPHFLFNALNTIYFQVDEKNKEAKHSIEQLSDLLRYQLYDIEQEVTMEQEINYLKSYIAFQQLRMTERLALDIYFDPALKDQKIHPLLFQPLIENAFKYVRGEYQIKLEIKLNGDQIQFEIKNSVSPSQNAIIKKEEGIGIENLKRRLNLLYPNKYNLEMKQTESIFVVKLTINID